MTVRTARQRAGRKYKHRRPRLEGELIYKSSTYSSTNNPFSPEFIGSGRPGKRPPRSVCRAPKGPLENRRLEHRVDPHLVSRRREGLLEARSAALQRHARKWPGLVCG